MTIIKELIIGKTVTKGNISYNPIVPKSDKHCMIAYLQPAALGDQVEEQEEEEDGGRAAPVRRGRDPAEAVMPRHLQ